MDGAERSLDRREAAGAIEALSGAMESQISDENLIANLKSQIRLLQDRVKELEDENSKLSTRLSSCCCSERKIKFEDGNSLIEKSKEYESPRDKTIKKKAVEKTGYDARTMDHYSKRYIALKVMYFGQRFYGFASEAQMEPTVESEIFRALEKARLLVGGRKESCYSRCGRTDRGVSSVGQVIALYLRSKLKHNSSVENNNHNAEEQHDEEIDYVRVMNRVLPNDIRVLGWCAVPVGFSARFSCLRRKYKYLFWGANLNISAMERAGKKFVGEHDFRNFCKMDAANVHNYRRRILSFDISPCDMRMEGNKLWVFNIEGSAFLWHQVRCMVAVVFMVGQGLEDPDVIDILLDPSRIPRKPQYVMASENPLVLHSCEFEVVKFGCSSDAGEALESHLTNQVQAYELQAAIFKEALLSCLPITDDRSSSENRKSKKKICHVALLSRPTEPSYEERRAKLDSASKRS
ncbi:tRNA pseudouridine(38/39) synthase [Momordica charantia]|uniref:tRNA pseudouridine(38/39) synthase n=1 Tax=Momordica charantia TaxID=3673 RepID=A0A6J1BZJ9_MOMCH|nr:tRNA pseudouridine(38/39) synthase [Momordica charantia]XP_022133594.1 tRNA pseudouridine(38/39) synthase [Momordica charantia]